MTTMTEEFSPSPVRPTLLRGFITFSLTRIVIALAIVIGIFSAMRFALQVIDPGISNHVFWPPLIFIPVLVGAYVLYVRWVERRRVIEFSTQGALPEVALGYVTGAALFCALVGAMAALGNYVVTGYNSWELLPAPFLWMFFTAFLEEILFRGIVFRIAEESLGTWIALLVSAALFGAGHIFNPHATIASSMAVAVEAGMLLAAVYVYSRRLWMCIGLHAAWNFVQGSIFSIPVSGGEMKGLIVGHLVGPVWLTGGEFGAEASVMTVIVCSLLTAAFLRSAYLRGHFVAPWWMRSRRQPHAIRSPILLG